MKRTPSVSRVLLAVTALAALSQFAACGGGGKDAEKGPDLDLSHCQILWTSPGTSDARYDVYIVDMRIQDWVTGEKTYTLEPSEEVYALFYDEYLFAEGEYVSRAVTTGGTFSVTVGSTSMGGLVQFTDDGQQSYYELLGDDSIGTLKGSGGAGSFDGEWSDPDPEVNPDPGSGTISLTYQSTAMTIGVGHVNYAVCYDAGNTFAPETAVDRIERQALRRLRP